MTPVTDQRNWLKFYFFPKIKNVQNAPSQTVRDEMNVNNTAWLTARSDQSCRRDTLAWSVSLFVLLDLCTSWQTVCICFYHDWLIRGCLGCLPGITITIIIIINLIKAVIRWLSPVIMSPCAAWETPWENWQQPSQITSVVRCKVVGTADMICFVSS